jgi:hypothetical protein
MNTDSFGGALFAYPWPFHREGFEAALDRVERSGCRELVITPAYHRADFFQPHDPGCPILYGENGVVFFDVDASRYGDTEIRPRRSRHVVGADWFERVVDAVRDRGLHVSLWAVYNFTDELSDRYPRLARHDPFGQPHRGALSCGAAAVRAYFTALTDDLLARFAPAYVWVESLQRRGMSQPGKTRAPVTPRCHFLLALDCHPEMLRRAQEHGLEATAFRQDLVDWLGPRLARTPRGDDGDPVDAEWISTAFDGRLGRYLDICRQETTQLWLDVAARIHAAGAGIHHVPVTDAAPAHTDLDPAVMRQVDRLFVSSLDHDPAAQVGAARSGLADGAQVYAGLHGSYDAEASVEADVAAARDAGCDGASFYAYGLLREEQLGWIGSALGSG